MPESNEWTGKDELKRTLTNVARGGQGITGTERMRAALALCYLLEEDVPSNVTTVLHWGTGQN